MTTALDFVDLPAWRQTTIDAAHAAADLDELRRVESAAIGRNSAVLGLRQRLGSLDEAERRVAGQMLNDAVDAVKAAIAEQRAVLERRAYELELERDRSDLTEVIVGSGPGHVHIVTQTREHLEDVFVAMGFTVIEGPEIETDWNNFQALNIPPAHPARSMQDTLYLDYGAEETVLIRTQTSPVQIRIMQEQEPPIYGVMPGRVYRKDTPNPRRIPTFNQIEGLVVDKDITFASLAGTIETFTKAYFGPSMTSRLRPAYFPFTEPSAEFEVTCVICAGKGCRTCSHTGWIELGGCGMVHPKVFANVGVDASIWSGFAFGFGIDRLAQMRYAIEDARLFLENDIRFLEQF